MLILKTNPSGVDIPIEKYQSWLFDQLKGLWKLNGDGDFDCYGRVYKNNSETGYVPEVFVDSLSSTNKVYNPILFDETRNTVVSFFYLNDQVNYEDGSSTTKVSLIFLTNLDKINKGVDHRPDEEIKLDVMRLVHTGKYGFEFTSIETGLKNVAKDFDGWLKSKDETTFLDRHPRYCFKVNFNLLYNIFDNN